MRSARKVFFPLDEQLGLEDGRYSEGVLKEITWLGGMMKSYVAAEEVFARIGHVYVSDSSAWRRTQDWGEEFKDIEDKQVLSTSALSGGREIQHGLVESGGRQGVAMDGGMVHLRQEGWKELKVGCVFEVEVQPTRDVVTGDVIDLAHAVQTSYTAHLGGPERFGQQVWAEAKQRGWEAARETEVVADGAPWIWNVVTDYFYDSQQIVDWYHASEHLAAAARILKGEGTPAAAQWLKEHKLWLFQGHAEQIVQCLRQAAQEQPNLAEELEKEAGYFENNKNRMNYQEMRENGFVIGSGMVESGEKQFKTRFCGPGMRWSRPGAEKLIPIRTAILSRRFDSVWRTAYHSHSSRKRKRVAA